MENTVTHSDSVKKITLSGNELILGLDGRNINISLTVLKEFLGVQAVSGIGGVVPNEAYVPGQGSAEAPAIYFATPGTYTGFNGAVVESPLAVLSWDGGAAEVMEVPIPPAENKIKDWEEEYGLYSKDMQVAVGDVVYRAMNDTEQYPVGSVNWEQISRNKIGLRSVGKNLFRKDLVVLGDIDASGNIVSSSTSKIVKGQPIVGGVKYVLSGMGADPNKRIIYSKEDGTLTGPIENMSVMPRAITPPADAISISYVVKTGSDVDDSVFANFQIEVGDTPTAFEAPSVTSNKINGIGIEASRLAVGNITPDASSLQNAVNLGQMYNQYQGRVFEGVLKTDPTLGQQRNLLNEVITDIKITGGKDGKEYMLRAISFKDVSAKDYTTFSEGNVIDGVFVETRPITAIANGTVNPQIPDILAGKAYARYDLGEGVIAEIWFDFDRKVNWTLSIFAIAANSPNVAFGCYINRRKVLVASTRDFLRRNYQGSIFGGTLQASSNANAINLLNSVIEDVRITGAKEVDVFQIWTACFDHPTLKDYIRFRKGRMGVNGIPIWESDQTLYSSAEHPDYPSTLTGRCRALYQLQNGVTIEIWYDFDKKIFAPGANIPVSDTTGSLGYTSYFSKAKMLPENQNIPTGTYPTFPTAKIAIFTNSIGATNGGQTTWVQPAMLMLGNPTWINYGDGGAAFRQRNKVGIDDMPTQLANSAGLTDVDAVIVDMGTNEFHAPAPPVGDNTPNVGSFDVTMAKPIADVITDVETLGVEATMYDAIRYAMYKIQQRWNPKIYMCLPIQRGKWNYKHIEILRTALTEMGIAYGAEIIDLAKCGIVYDFEVDGGAGRDLHDGLHPKDVAAYEKIAKMIVSSVRNTLVL